MKKTILLLAAIGLLAFVCRSISGWNSPARISAGNNSRIKQLLLSWIVDFCIMVYLIVWYAFNLIKQTDCWIEIPTFNLYDYHINTGWDKSRSAVYPAPDVLNPAHVRLFSDNSSVNWVNSCAKRGIQIRRRNSNGSCWWIRVNRKWDRVGRNRH